MNRESRNGPLENQRRRRRRYLGSDLRVLLRGHPENSQKPGDRKNSFKHLPGQWREFKAGFESLIKVCALIKSPEIVL